MGHLWSRAVATSGNQWQSVASRKGPRMAETGERSRGGSAMSLSRCSPSSVSEPSTSSAVALESTMSTVAGRRKTGGEVHLLAHVPLVAETGPACVRPIRTRIGPNASPRVSSEAAASAARAARKTKKKASP